MSGRFTPEIADVKAVAKATLRHRIVANFNAEADNVSTTHVIDSIIKELN